MLAARVAVPPADAIRESMDGLPDPGDFVFVPSLEAAFPEILAELRRLGHASFVESPDSLTTVADGYDETGWRWYPLFGDGADLAQNRARCPDTARACTAVPGMVNAGFSLFRPGTHLYPHRGEMPNVLRCHLPLLVPPGDVALRSGDSIHRWRAGCCVILDDTVEHEAWNHGSGDRVVLIVTFAHPLRHEAR